MIRDITFTRSDVWSSFNGEVLYCRRDVRNHHDPLAIALSYVFPLIEANLATTYLYALYSKVKFMYGPFFCGSLASATAFKTFLFASAINTVR